MKNFMQCVLIFLLFFMATVAIIQVDRQCREVTGSGGSVSAFADSAVVTASGKAVKAVNHAKEAAAAQAEFIVEKIGSLG